MGRRPGTQARQGPGTPPLRRRPRGATPPVRRPPTCPGYQPTTAGDDGAPRCLPQPTVHQPAVPAKYNKGEQAHGQLGGGTVPPAGGRSCLPPLRSTARLTTVLKATTGVSRAKTAVGHGQRGGRERYGHTGGRTATAPWGRQGT